MANLTQSLKATLEGVTQGFRDAARDLNDAVAELSASVNNVTDGRGKVELEVEEECTEWVAYAVYLVIPNEEKDVSSVRDFPLLYFGIQATGYPIRLLSVVPSDEGSMKELVEVTESQYQDRSQLAKFFESVVTNKDSRLVQQLAFYLRTQRSASSNAGG